MQPTSAAHGLWTEGRCICAGSPVETVQNLGKVAETIFRTMTPNAKVRYTDQSFPLILSGSGASDPERGKLAYNPIAANASVHWQMELLPFGLFHSQNKLLPLRFMPLILEFTLGGMQQMFNTASYASNWELDGLYLQCDELIIESGMDSALAERLSQGTPLNIPITTHISFHQALPDGSQTPTVVVNRALSKLNEVWVSFAKDVSVTNEAKSPFGI